MERNLRLKLDDWKRRVPVCAFSVLSQKFHYQIRGEGAYVAQGGQWVKEEPTQTSTHRVLLTKFQQTADVAGALMATVAEREHTFAFNPMTEFLGRRKNKEVLA